MADAIVAQKQCWICKCTFPATSHSARYCSKACVSAMRAEKYATNVEYRAIIQAASLRARTPISEETPAQRMKRLNAKKEYRLRAKEVIKAQRERAKQKRIDNKPIGFSLDSWKRFNKRRVASLESGRLGKRDAWKDWLSNAPSEWLDNYYSAKPWLDHRLTNSESNRIRRKHCPKFAIYDRMRSHLARQQKDGNAALLMREALKRDGESPKIHKLFGYTIEELKCHLEKQFTKGMSWEVFGDGNIHIDHIVPRSSFDMSKESELMACWSLANLRPMWAADNLKKSDKFEYLC